jgi:hypothetical protein
MSSTLTGLVVVAAVAAPGTRPTGDWAALPVDAPFDYQIGGDYTPASDVELVVRDWFEGEPLESGYSICYVNAFQTQPDDEDVERPDERSNWPGHLVLTELGDDPHWEGEYLVDLATADARRDAAAWVEPMLRTCADKGFAAVEFDNLDSWTRFDGTTNNGVVPFGPDESAAYAALLVEAAHSHGLAAAQKNALELASLTDVDPAFDFLIVERCGEFDECDDAARLFGHAVLAVEYEPEAFAAACAAIGEQSSVVLRDVDVSRPGSATYRYEAC